MFSVKGKPKFTKPREKTQDNIENTHHNLSAIIYQLYFLTKTLFVYFMSSGLQNITSSFIINLLTDSYMADCPFFTLSVNSAATTRPYSSLVKESRQSHMNVHYENQSKGPLLKNASPSCRAVSVGMNSVAVERVVFWSFFSSRNLIS